jgi:hypothetical protein
VVCRLGRESPGRQQESADLAARRARSGPLGAWRSAGNPAALAAFGLRECIAAGCGRCAQGEILCRAEIPQVAAGWLVTRSAFWEKWK